MTDLTKSIRDNRYFSLCFALVIGFIFRYSYGIAKDVIWANRKLDFIAGLVDPSSVMQMTILAITMNILVELSSSLLPALLCGIILIYIFQKRAFLFSLASAAIFLALSTRLWRFWKAPDIGMQISTLMGPILSVLVLVTSVWLVQNQIKKRNEDKKREARER